MPKAHILVTFLIALVCSSCDFTSPEEYYNQALELEKKEKFEEAIIKLDKAIDKSPEFRVALINRGVYKSNINNHKKAIEDYHIVLQIDPDNTLALMNIGHEYHNLKKYEKSIEYYSKALKTEGAIDSDIKFVFLNLSQGNDQDSDYNISKAELHFERGLTHLQDKQYDKAIVDFKTSLEANYEERDNYFFIGEAYLGKKDSVNACQNFIESARLGDLDAREKLKEYCLKKKSK